MEDEVEKMRKEIVELEQLLEIQRLQNMAWWETSDQYQEELEASEEVREEYEECQDRNEDGLYYRSRKRSEFKIGQDFGKYSDSTGFVRERQSM